MIFISSYNIYLLHILMIFLKYSYFKLYVRDHHQLDTRPAGIELVIVGNG